jgi:hypothetical protein
MIFDAPIPARLALGSLRSADNTSEQTRSDATGSI